ncbi:putative cell wall galactomanno protein [Neofusicoccum parvum]|nr:putative cell wall galactomanno protein [Neofusicoccum parvum]
MPRLALLNSKRCSQVAQIETQDPKMRFLPTLLLAASAASAASLTKRLAVTPDVLIQDITNIHNGVLANQQASQNYAGGNLVTTLVDGAPVLLTVGAIHVANRKGFADANLSPPIGEPDTVRIFQHVVDTVGVSIPSAVRTLKAKKPQFAASGMTATVIASLKLLLNDHDTFSAALTAKSYQANATLTAQGVEVVDDIHNAIQSGIDAYSS